MFGKEGRSSKVVLLRWHWVCDVLLQHVVAWRLNVGFWGIGMWVEAWCGD